MGLSIVESQATLDTRFPVSGGTDWIGYSTNGTSETANLARTAVGATGWAAATAADPSVKSNGTALTSAAATGAAVITHYAVFSASTAGTQRSDWQAVDTSKTLTIGDSVSWAIGALDITLT